MASDEVKKVEFLLNLCNYPCDFLPEKLKTHLSYVCQLTAQRAQKILPKALKDAEYVCEYCCTQFNHTNCKIKILPKIQPGSGMRRILNKVKHGKKLSTVEKKLAMRVQSGNRLVIKCMLCLKKTQKFFNKPEEVQVIEEAVETPVVSKKKKKKKRKKPILNLSALPSPQKEIIDLTDDKPGRSSLDFIPLVASTPFAKSKPANPLSLKKKPANVSVQNKRNSLKKLLEEECFNSQRSVKSLKDFLSRVNP